MKRLQLLIGVTFLLILGLVGGGRLVSAHSFHTGNNVSLNSPNPIRQTVFVAGNTVDISSEVFGDVFCAGQTVTISGTVHGDVLCAGQTVNVSGRVDGDVRLAGQSVNVNSTVNGNATIGAQSFILDSKGTVNGDATLGVTDATLNGSVGRDVAAGGTTLNIGNQVGRNIKASVMNLRLTSGARVNGNIEVTSQNQVSQAPGAVVTGKVTRTEPTQKQQGGGFFRAFWLWAAYWLVALVVMTFILALLFPRMMQAVSNRALPRPWWALLTGFVASVVMPVVIILLAATVVGLPLALIVGLLWMVALILSGPLFAYYVGRLILRRSQNALLIALVGAVVVGIIYFIPILNIFLALAAYWVGTGTLLLELFQRTPKPAYQVEPLTSGKK